MRTITKYAAAAVMAGALAVAVATPSQARWHGAAAAAAGGFAAGALVGAAAANSYAYGPGYYYDPYYYGPGYDYDYAPVYTAPAPRYRAGGCWHYTDKDRGYGYYGAC